MKRLANATRQFILDPLEKRSPALFLFRLSQIFHERSKGRYDNQIRGVLSRFRPKVDLPTSNLLKDEELQTTVAALDKHGWRIIPWRLPPADIAEIKAFAFSTPGYADNQNERIRIREDRVPNDHGRYQWRMHELIRVPAVQRLIADSALHRIAQSYLRACPVLTSITLWLDPPHKGHFEAHMYHYDNDGPAFLKFFIFINDIQAQAGTHNYIQGSHHHVKPDGFGISRRYERDELLDFYGVGNEMVFSGAAGTILAEDTAGFHRGITPTAGYRMLLQLQYGVIDIPHVEEFTPEFARFHGLPLDRSIKKIARKFFG